MKIKYQHIKQIDSTNSFAKRELSKLSKECWTAISADTQLMGRGQSGSVWIDNPGDSLLMTIISPVVKLSSDEIMKIHMTSSLAIKDFLSNRKVNVKLKWPNDIYMGTQKIAGILSEANWKAGFCNRFFLGFGINVRSAPFGSAFMGHNFDPISLRQPIAIKIITQLNSLNLNTLSEYEQSLFHWNIKCVWQNIVTQRFFEAKTTAIFQDGRMQLTFQSGEKRIVANGEVKWISLS